MSPLKMLSNCGSSLILVLREETAQRQHARVVLDGDGAGAQVRAVLQHGGELVQPERLPAPPHALLDEEHLALASEAQGEGDGHQQGRKHQQGQAGKDDIE